MIRFHGEPGVFFMAICHECDIALPFGDREARAEWIAAHSQTGHRIDVAVDVRIASLSPLTNDQPEKEKS